MQETTEALYESDIDIIAMEKELTELHRVIKMLIDAIKAIEVKQIVLYTTLEKQARECRECCLRRLWIRN